MTANRSKAFTLVELLVVISIIALLLSILMPSLNSARTQAKIVVCASNQRQLGLAMVIYMADNEDHYPTFYAGSETPEADRGDYYDETSWVRLFQVYVDGQREAKHRKPFSKTFYCPLGPVPGKSKWIDCQSGSSNPWPTNNSHYVTYGYNMYALGLNLYSGSPRREPDVTPTSAKIRGSEFLVLVDNASIHWASTSSGACPSPAVHRHTCPIGCTFISRNHPKDMANVLFGDNHVAATSRKVIDDPFFNDVPNYTWRNGNARKMYPWITDWHKYR